MPVNHERVKTPPPDLGFVQASQIVPVQMKWIWYPFIPAGELVLLEGHPGLGKSTITCSLAADLSQGRALPGDVARDPMRVLMLSTEDLMGAIILQRLQANDADLDNIFVSNKAVALNGRGLVALADKMHEVDATVIMIDPLVAYIGAGVDMYRANETRAALEPLKDLAQSTGTTVILVRHLRKNTDGDKRMAGLGSIDFFAHARSVVQVEEEHGGTLINNIKNNYAKHGTRIVYTIEDQRLSWGRYFKPGEGLKVSKTSRRAGEYQDWLRAKLAGGPRTATELEELAAADGLSWTAIKGSAKGVAYCFKGKGKVAAWSWALEKSELVAEEDPQTSDSPVFDATAMAAAIKANMRREQ